MWSLQRYTAFYNTKEVTVARQAKGNMGRARITKLFYEYIENRNMSG
jgi:hypothetical protein